MLRNAMRYDNLKTFIIKLISFSDKGDCATPPGPKKLCLEKSNGVEASLFDMSNTDHMVAMTQLKEQIESLRRQLLAKEQALLEKDKKVCSLAHNKPIVMV